MPVPRTRLASQRPTVAGRPLRPCSATGAAGAARLPLPQLNQHPHNATHAARFATPAPALNQRPLASSAPRFATLNTTALSGVILPLALSNLPRAQIEWPAPSRTRATPRCWPGSFAQRKKYGGENLRPFHAPPPCPARVLAPPGPNFFLLSQRNVMRAKRNWFQPEGRLRFAAGWLRFRIIFGYWHLLSFLHVPPAPWPATGAFFLFTRLGCQAHHCATFRHGWHT